HATRAPDHGARGRHGIAASGVGVISCRFRLVQQSPLPWLATRPPFRGRGRCKGPCACAGAGHGASSVAAAIHAKGTAAQGEPDGCRARTTSVSSRWPQQQGDRRSAACRGHNHRLPVSATECQVGRAGPAHCASNCQALWTPLRQSDQGVVGSTRRTRPSGLSVSRKIAPSGPARTSRMRSPSS
ncbi:MAG: hypothetical protein ACI83N_000660, partial [Hydrogenophaga sp.]